MAPSFYPASLCTCSLFLERLSQLFLFVSLYNTDLCQILTAFTFYFVKQFREPTCGWSSSTRIFLFHGLHRYFRRRQSAPKNSTGSELSPGMSSSSKRLGSGHTQIHCVYIVHSVNLNVSMYRIKNSNRRYAFFPSHVVSTRRSSFPRLMCLGLRVLVFRLRRQ